MGAIEYTAESLEQMGPPAPEGSPRQLVERIQAAVGSHFGIRRWQILSRDRHKSTALARHIAMYLVKTKTSWSFPEIGRAFGGRDHTTVMSAVRKVGLLLATDLQTVGHVAAIEVELERTAR
jgi:chromosomal replication initiator protein